MTFWNGQINSNPWNGTKGLAFLLSFAIWVTPSTGNATPFPVEESLRQSVVRILIYSSDLSTDSDEREIVASGSGVIIEQEEQAYTVLTNRHVVAFGSGTLILTHDGQQYEPSTKPILVNDNDLALLRFISSRDYGQAIPEMRPAAIGDQVYSLGFPTHQTGTTLTTFDLGIEAFRQTEGQINLLLSRALTSGYDLGYTNDIELGMSGGPIFSSDGFLVGINGRVKGRDPGFGAYRFADGSQPSPEQLQQITPLSWGISIQAYLDWLSQSDSR